MQKQRKQQAANGKKQTLALEGRPRNRDSVDAIGESMTYYDFANRMTDKLIVVFAIYILLNSASFDRIGN